MTLARSLLSALVLPALAATTASGVDVKLGDQLFQVSDGLEADLAAGPPLVERPITCDIDEEGRLYASESSGTNDKVQKQLEEKPHRILRLVDTDGDGRFDQRTVFADRMMFPEGTLWYDGSLYVAAPPSIWKLTDRDGDGIAEERVEWFQGKTLTGCANDLHGPYLGPDGWIYWCKGAFAEQHHVLGNGKPFATRASHIFRALPDGSGLEPVLTGGMDNPVDVVFTRGGERILSTTFFQQPGGGKRDGLIHAVYGGVYGKAHEVLEGHRRTGDLMPVLTHLGPGACCGLVRPEGDAFGGGTEESVYLCSFNLHKVTRHALVPDGASFTTRDSDVISSTSVDFHPTDVIEDADGSLLVVNTGGWYKLCCPTSQLWKPDVLGGIYRVRRKDAPAPHDPRGRGLDWHGTKPEDLAARLGDPRFAVRRRAVEALARAGASAVPALARTLAESPSAEARRQAVWALARIDAPAAREAACVGLRDAAEPVRLTAAHAASVRRDAGAIDALLQALQTGSPALRRASAEALGRLGDRRAVPAILEAASTPCDRVLEHSLAYALIEIGDVSGARAALDAKSSQARRTALIALDAMDGGGVDPAAVLPLLASSDAILRSTAAWLVERHPEWGGALAGFFREKLGAADLPDAERADLERLLARLARSAEVQALCAAVLEANGASRASRESVLRAMARSGLKEMPPAWTKALAGALTADDGDLARYAVSAARAFSAPGGGAPELAAALLRLGSAAALPAEVRLEALAAVPGGLASVDGPLFEFMTGALDASNPVAMRQAAAGALERARLDLEQLRRLAEIVKTAGPLELPRVLHAFEKAADEGLGKALISSLKESAGAAGLRADVVKTCLASFPASVQDEGVKVVESLDEDVAAQRARVQDLIKELAGGDVRRGQAVFNGAKAACSTCHAIGYLGGTVGPDLTRIGQLRTERDLLEAILFPSVSFVRSYEPVVVMTRRGEAVSGVIRRDAPDEIVLATGATTEARIAREDVADVQPGAASIMPAGLEKQISIQDLADLVAFLRACK